MTAAVEPWRVRRTEGPAGPFHALVPDGGAPFRPTVWVHRPSDPALVLGSTQPADVIDVRAATAAGWEVCRRHSGGGLVVLTPGAGAWIDIFIPPTHPRWDDDVGRAFHWPGRLWAEALGAASPQAVPLVHTGPLQNREDGRLLCFAGLGPGEVTVAGHKVVGLSQRRTRAGARFQGLALLDWDPSPIADFGSVSLRAAAERHPGLGWPGSIERPTVDTVVKAFLAAAGAPIDDWPVGPGGPSGIRAE